MTVLDPTDPASTAGGHPGEGPPDSSGSSATPGAPATSRPRPRLLDATAIVASIGVVAALIGVVILALPVQSPLQDCGTSYGFLIHGRTDVIADPANPPKGHDRSEVEAANARPCRTRVADRARIAAWFLLGGLTLAIGSLLVEAIARSRLRHQRDRAARASAAAAFPPATGGDPTAPSGP